MMEMDPSMWKIVSTHPLILPNHSRYFREPPRPYDDMQPGYISRYDGHTLAVDIFNSDRGLVAIGAPLNNLSGPVNDAVLMVDGSPLNIAGAWQDINRASRLILPTTAPAETVRLDLEHEPLSCPVSMNQCSMFAGRNVAITMNWCNPLENIRDWLVNLVVNHRVTGAIIYDNRSYTYSTTQLLEVMRSVPGLEVGVVVDWPYKYGNMGSVKNGWDSDFGQYMAWEHARWRFLARANTLVVADIDEIPVAEVAGVDLVSLVEATPDGVYLYSVRNVPEVSRDGLTPDRVRLCSDYELMDFPQGTLSRKSVCQPGRIPVAAQVGNHGVFGVQSIHGSEVIARHIRGIHQSWRAGRITYSYPERTLNPETDAIDERWIAHCHKTFPERFETD